VWVEILPLPQDFLQCDRPIRAREDRQKGAE